MSTIYINYKGICPRCNKTNNFKITEEELRNNYHFSCSYCEKETVLNEYEEVEK